MIKTSQLVRVGLGERLADRGRDDQGAVADRVERLSPGLRPHHHAGPAAVGRVVHRPVHVVRPGPQVVHRQVKRPGRPGLADQRQLKRGEEVRKYRDNVDAHQRSSRPSGRSTTIRPPATSTVGTRAVTNGIRAVPPPDLSNTIKSDAGAWSIRATDPRSSPPTETTRSPTHWWSWNSSGSA